jgi:hypothetical protein
MERESGVFVLGLCRRVGGFFYKNIEYGVSVWGKCITQLDIKFCGFVYVVFFQRVDMSCHMLLK